MTMSFCRLKLLLCACVLFLCNACTPSPSSPSPAHTATPDSTDTPSQPEWSEFTPAREIFAENNVYSAAVEPDGTVWLGTDAGPFRYNGTAWERITSGLPAIHIPSIAIGPAGGVWAATTEGVARLGGSSWDRIKEAYGRNKHRCEDITVGPDGSLWFASMTSIARYDGGEEWEFEYFPLGKEGTTITTLSISPNGDFWLGTYEGVNRFDSSMQTLTTFTVEDGLPDNHINTIHCSSNGITFIGTPSGAAIFDGESWTELSEKNKLIGYSVEYITVGPDGNIWLLTDQALNIYHDPALASQALQPTSAFTAIPSYTPAPTRTIAPTLGPTSTPTQLPSPLLRVGPVNEIIPGDTPTLYTACDGSLWLITDTAAARLEEGTWQPVLTEITGTIAGIDLQGLVWLITESGDAISARDETSWTEFGLEENWQPLMEAGSTSLGQCSLDGLFWLTSADDVRSFDGEKWTVYDSEDLGMDNISPESWSPLFLATQQSTGFVWVGGCNFFGAGPTGGPGARWYDGEHWLGAGSPAAEGCVSAIVEDTDGDMWLGVDEILWRVDSASGAWIMYTPPETPFGYRRFGAISALESDLFGNIWAAELMCGGACCDSLALYRIQNSTWTLALEKETWVTDFTALSNSSGSWFFADGIYRLNASGIAAVSSLYPQIAAIDPSGKIWFLIQDYPQSVLCTIDPEVGE